MLNIRVLLFAETRGRDKVNAHKRHRDTQQVRFHNGASTRLYHSVKDSNNDTEKTIYVIGFLLLGVGKKIRITYYLTAS